MDLEVLMPVITEAGEEAVVTAWFVDDGDKCVAGQMIAEVQAEKVAEEVEATGPGYVVDRVALGDPVPQGNSICRIVESVEASGQAAPVASVTTGSSSVSPVRASPSAKRVARELGVDLATVSGSGPSGRITEDDVRGKTSGSKLMGLRAVIARNMRRSHTETAPVTLFSTVELGASIPQHLTAVIVKTVAQVLEDHPELNGIREDDVFTPSDHAQIGLAIQTDGGLVAPVVRDAAGRPLDELVAVIAELADSARAMELTAEDFEGGTFTVTNLGRYGVEGFTPIINLPQIAILGVGAAKRVPTIDADGKVVVGYQLRLSLTFDHAFIDGAPAAAFLQQLGEALVKG